jgi:predicted esterase
MKLSVFPLALAFATSLAAARAADFFPLPPDAVRFTNSVSRVTVSELSGRMGASLRAGVYDLRREGFRVLAPPSAETNSGWGLFVWISPGHDAYIPKDWEPLFAKHQLVFAAPYGSGNDRDITERFRLALDAVHQLCARYGLERKRVFVGGFSGGGRVASMLAVAYADVFAGAFCVCGVNFYQDVAFSSEDIGGARIPGGGLAGQGVARASPTILFQASFRPPRSQQTLAKRQLRLYLLTGTKDPNRLNTKAVFEEGFKKAGYRAVKYREIPGFGHAIPNAAELEKALAFLCATAG